MIDKKFLYKTGIYKLMIEEHLYVGSSVNLYKRLGVHFRTLRSKTHENQYLQRCVDKYGIDKLSYEVIETYEDITKEELLQKEEFYIKTLCADLNLKLTPTTQQNCITTSKKVYQFTLLGELIKEWPSVSEASRCLNIDVSNITTACLNRKRQRVAAGYLWDYTSLYTGEIEVLYVFDLNGKFLNKFATTVEIYESYFPNQVRKSVLTSIKKIIDKNIPYKNIYISTNIDFKVPENYKPKYRETDELDEIFAKNPIIYRYSKSGELLESKHLNDFKNQNYIKRKIRSGAPTYSLGKPNKYTNWNSLTVKVTNLTTKHVSYYNSLQIAVKELLGDEMNLYKNAYKHLNRGTPYKNFLFEKGLVKPCELLEHP